MRTHLLFTLAFLCSGAIASAQQMPPSPGTSGDGPTLVPSLPSDTATSLKHHVSSSMRAATDASSNEPPTAGPGKAPPITSPLPLSYDAPVESMPHVDSVMSSGGGGGGGGGGLFWVSGSYVLGWLRPISLPTPLLTTGSINDAAPGALLEPNTSILFGTNLKFETYSGVQVSAGLFLDDSKCFSVEGKALYLDPKRIDYTMTSDAAGNPLITRPFFNVVDQRESAFIDSFPNFAAGSVNIRAKSELWGFEGNARYHVGGKAGMRGDILAGFRYLRLSEKLEIRDTVRPLANNVLTYRGAFITMNDSIFDQDRFRTGNQFYGFQFGGGVTYEESWVTVSAYAKLGIGGTEQRANISGSTTLTTPAGTDTSVGGILALPPNIGNRSRTVFGLVPEWGLTLGAAVTENIRVNAGYSFLLWNRVARPGDVINRNINPSFVPTDTSFGVDAVPVQPAFAFRNSDAVFWMHTFNLGMELMF